MNVVIVLDKASSADNLFKCLNENLNATVFFNEPSRFENINYGNKNYSVFSFDKFENYITENYFDFVLTNVFDTVKNFVDESKIIDVSSLVNKDWLQKNFLLRKAQQNISEFELVAIGGGETLMGVDFSQMPVKSLNLSAMKQDLYFSFRMLEKILSMPNKIKYVVLGLAPYSFRYDMSQSENKWSVMSYYSIFKDVHNLPIDSNIFAELFGDYFLGNYELLCSLSDDNKIISANEIDFNDPHNHRKLNERNLTKKDFFYVRHEAKKWANEKYAQNFQMNGNIFIEILKLCHERKIKPIVVTFPPYYPYKREFPKFVVEEFHLLIEEIKKILPFYFFDYYELDSGDMEDFSQIDCLNSYGSQGTTRKIRRLIEKFEKNKIRVAFISQGGNLASMESVYRAMIMHDDIEVFIVVSPMLPKNISQVNRNNEPDVNNPDYIKAKEFAQINYGNNQNTVIVNALLEGGWVDMESFHFDYFFYLRPYEYLLPPQVQCQLISQFSKTCYIPYALTTSQQFIDFYRDECCDFLSTCNFFFADCEEFAKDVAKNYLTEEEDSDQHFVFLGSSEMENWSKNFKKDFEKNLNKKYESVFWTPRWTHDSNVCGGGSHFMEYKDKFIALRSKYKDLKIATRPHPNLWETLVSEKRMSEKSIEIYKKTLKKNKIWLDDGKQDFYKIFSEYDIMITDVTSIMIKFLLTGKPVIYCPCGYPLVGDAKIEEPGIYIANNWDEVEKYLEMLLNGEDPLKEVRRKIFDEIYKLHDGVTERVVQYIVDDYNKSSKIL